MKKKGIRLSAALLVFVMLSILIISGASADREVQTKPEGMSLTRYLNNLIRERAGL